MPHCLACGYQQTEPWALAKDEEYFTTENTFTYYSCRSCKALSIDPVPRDLLNSIYPHNYYSFSEEIVDSWVFRVKDWLDQRFYKRFLNRLSKPSISVLDVGGGCGTQLTSLRRVETRINRTTIVDMDERAAAIARDRGHEFFCGSFENFDSSQPYDVILMLNLIEHVDNPTQLLAKARSLLANNGIIILKTPNTDSLDARLFRHRNWGGYHCPRHWVLFNRENLTGVANRAGLEMSYCEYCQGAPFWATSILFALYRRRLIHASSAQPVPYHSLYRVLSILFAAFDICRSPFSKTSQMLAVFLSGKDEPRLN